MRVLRMPSRRDFLTAFSAAGAATAFGSRASLADEGPPETTTLRLGRITAICAAPSYIADGLLRAEGFTDIRHTPRASVDAVARGEIDFDLETAASVVSNVDAGQSITALAGVHVGCYELFAHEPIRTISDLKGKRVESLRRWFERHLLLAASRRMSDSTRTRTSTG